MKYILSSCVLFFAEAAQAAPVKTIYQMHVNLVVEKAWMMLKPPRQALLAELRLDHADLRTGNEVILRLS